MGQGRKILKIFKQHLECGYYPYFLAFESVPEFKMTLEQNLHTTLEPDLVAIYPHLSGNSIKKIKRLEAQKKNFPANTNQLFAACALFTVSLQREK